MVIVTPYHTCHHQHPSAYLGEVADKMSAAVIHLRQNVKNERGHIKVECFMVEEHLLRTGQRATINPITPNLPQEEGFTFASKHRFWQ